MSSRRSARLSSASRVTETSTPVNGASPDKSANIGKKRKTVSQESIEPLTSGNDATPSTPRKRAKPPLQTTETPAAIRLMKVPYKSGGIDNSPPPVNRLVFADNNLTNAPLVTPETHRVLANKPIDQVSPSKVSTVKTTTSNVLDEAIAHIIKTEPKLKPVVEKNHCHVFSPEGLAEEIDPFRSLTSGIISQQVSGAAAKSIKAKFVALFNTDQPDVALHAFPTPSQVCGSSIETIRTAGLSQRKAEYVHGLAQKFHSGELTTSMLLTASYEEVLEELIKVRGLGKWSVEMFASFVLKRLDVFSTGDLGVQRGMAVLMGRDVAKLKSKGGGKWKYMSEKEMLQIAEKFKPYRSVFMWLMWQIADTDISAMEN